MRESKFSTLSRRSKSEKFLAIYVLLKEAVDINTDIVVTRKRKQGPLLAPDDVTGARRRRSVKGTEIRRSQYPATGTVLGMPSMEVKYFMDFDLTKCVDLHTEQIVTW